MIVPAQAAAAAEVGRAALVQPHHHVHAPRLQRRDHPIRAEEPVGQHDIAGPEMVDDHPQQGQLAGLLPLIAAHRGLEHRAHGQAEDHQDPRDREAQPGLLAGRLGIRLLVPRGIGHDHRRAIDDLDRPAMEQPREVGLLVDGAPDRRTRSQKTPSGRRARASQ